MTLGLEFEDRAQELNFLSAARFHNSNDASVLGVHIWRRALDPAHPEPGPLSLPHATMRLNPLAAEFQPQLIDHSQAPPVRVNPSVRPSPLTSTEQKARRLHALTALEADKTNVAASVLVRQDGKPHSFLTA